LFEEIYNIDEMHMVRSTMDDVFQCNNIPSLFLIAYQLFIVPSDKYLVFMSLALLL